MGRPRATAEDIATTERLLSAAEDEFGKAGFDGARLEDIARRAGITRPSLLYHFSTKEELYTAVIHRAFDRLREVLSSAMHIEGTFEHRMDEAVARPIQFLSEYPALARLLLWELIDGRGPGHDLLRSEVPPLLDWVEHFVRKEGHGRVKPSVPVRAAILQLACAAILRAAAGSLREPLFGSKDRSREIARALFLGD